MKGAKLVFVFMFLIVLSLFVSATSHSLGDVEILSINPTGFDGNQGDTFHGSFDVHNKGTTSRTITLVTDPSPTIFGVSFSSNNFVLNAGQTKSITYDVVTDASDHLGDNPFDIYASDSTDTSHQDYFTINVKLSLSA